MDEEIEELDVISTDEEEDPDIPDGEAAESALVDEDEQAEPEAGPTYADVDYEEAGTDEDPVDADNTEVVTPAITETRTRSVTVRELISDYSAESLAAYEAAGYHAVALYDDGSEAYVQWSEVVEPVPEEVVIVNEAYEVAAATNQHFWHGDDGAHVTDEEKDDWEAEYAKSGHGTLADPTDSRPWHNIMMNSLGILLRRGLRNLVSITKSAIAFFDGQGNDAANVVASFGANGARIGKSNNSNVSIVSSKVSINKADEEIIKFGLSDGTYNARQDFTFTSSDLSGGNITLQLPTSPITAIVPDEWGHYIWGRYQNASSSMAFEVQESECTLNKTTGVVTFPVPTISNATYTVTIYYTYSGAKPYMEFGPRDNAEYPGSHQVRLDWVGNIAMGPVLRQYADASNSGFMRFRSENRDGVWARFYGADDANGDAVVLGAGGLFVAGGGESAPNLYNNHLKEHLALTPGSESTWLSSDSYLRIVTNANSVSKTDASMLYVWDFAANGVTTFPGTVILPKRQDASGTANNSPALIVGGTASQSHIEIDDNEIQAKTNGTSAATLYLNGDGGDVYAMGSKVMTVAGGTFTGKVGFSGTAALPNATSGGFPLILTDTFANDGKMGYMTWGDATKALSAASSSAQGAMSAADKAKLDKVSIGSTVTITPTASAGNYRLVTTNTPNLRMDVYKNGAWSTTSAGGSVYMLKDTDILLKVTTTTSGKHTLAGNAASDFTVAITAPSGFELVGVVGISTNHNVACAVQSFYVSGNSVVAYVRNFASTAQTDLTISPRCLFALAGNF